MATLVVLEYVLECGCGVTVQVPVREVVSEQITGVMPVWCPKCGVVRSAEAVRMQLV